MELLANTIRYNYDNEPVNAFIEANDNISGIRSTPDSNFDTFLNAFITVFIVIANDGWTTIYFDYARVVGRDKASAFFILLVILGQWILFNLFLAILLKEFDDKSMQQEAET
jgi:hypothetical protein